MKYASSLVLLAISAVVIFGFLWIGHETNQAICLAKVASFGTCLDKVSAYKSFSTAVFAVLIFFLALQIWRQRRLQKHPMQNPDLDILPATFLDSILSTPKPIVSWLSLREKRDPACF